MEDCYKINISAVKIKELYYRGHKILYKGEDAHVIKVEPVLTISIDGKYHVICGNIVDEVRPFVN